MQLYILFLSKEKNIINLNLLYIFHSAFVRFGNIKVFFWDTYNAPLSKMSIDYAWSGCIIQSKPNKLPDEWNQYCKNHEHFMANRKSSLLIRNQPEDAFAFGFKNLQRSPYVLENILKQIKKDCCNSPKGFESAFSWKACDSDYFIKDFFWPCKDSDLRVPSHGSY